MSRSGVQQMPRRSFITLSTASALTLVAACGRSSDSETSQAQTVSSLASGKAEGKLSIWAMGAEGDALGDFAQSFTQQYPGVDIEVTAIPWDSAHDKIQTAIAAGTGPDLCQMGTTWMASFKDAFVPVPSDLSLDGIFDGSVETARFGEETLGVPWYVDTNVLYYRKDLAAAAGWNSAPTTWDELTAMSRDIVNKTEAEYAIRLVPTGQDCFQGMLWMPFSNGASLMDADRKKWTINTPEFAEAFEYYKSFFDEGLSSADASPNTGDLTAEFVSGKYAMVTTGPFLMGQLAQAGGEDFSQKYATAVLPRKKSSTSFVGGCNWVVFNTSKNAVTAWRFVEWMLQPQTQVDWYKLTGDLPSLSDAWKDSALAEDEKLAVFGQQLGSTQAPPPNNAWVEVAAAGDTLTEQIARGKTPVSDALASLQSQAESAGTE